MNLEGEHMITELNKQDFYLIKHITDKCKNIEARAVANGVNPGWVYVDDPEKITAAIIWIQGQNGFHIVGDSQSSSFLTGLNLYMKNVIEPRLMKLNITCVEISTENDSWDESVQKIFDNRHILNDVQHVIQLNGVTASSEIRVEKGTILRVDRELFHSRKFENQSLLEEKISRFWASTDDFLQQGFGYLAEYNNTIVSLCFSAFIVDQTHAIDIETFDGYKRNNYAAAVATAFVEECKQKGFSPYWDCSPENTGSIRLANNVGMDLYFNYKIFWYQLT